MLDVQYLVASAAYNNLKYTKKIPMEILKQAKELGISCGQFLAMIKFVRTKGYPTQIRRF